MLESYMPPANATLKSIQGDIMALGLRSKLLYSKAAQNMSFNHDTIKALVKALPEANHADAYRVLDELNAYYDGYPEYADFCTALSRYEVSINNNLEKIGNQRYSYTKQPFTFSSTKKKPILERNYNEIKAINAQPMFVHENFIDQDQRERPPLVLYENQVNRYNNYKSNSNSRSNYSSANNYRQNGINNFKPDRNGFNQKDRFANQNNENPNEKELGIKGRHACTLCGSNTHQASSGCFRMRNDYGRLVFCPPSQEPCSRCEKETNKILYHPEVLCFNRPKMKQMLSEGKFKFPTSEERQQLKDFIERGGGAR